MNLPRGSLFGSRARLFAPILGLLGFLPFLAFPASTLPSARSRRAAEADALPGSTPPAARDLLLSREKNSQADALASFADAILFEDNADSDKALEQYQKALALNPGYTELAVKVAFELARRGDASGGVQVLKDAIQASPKAPLPYLYLSQLYAKNLDKPQAGLKYAQQALDLDPANLAAYLGVYELLRATQQPKKAAEVLEKAAAAPSTDPQYWLQLGDFYLKFLTDGANGAVPAADRLSKVGAMYRKALDLGGNTVEILVKTADFYRLSHQEKEAIPLYLKALKFSPASAAEGDQTLAAIHDNLAKCLVATGQIDSAIATLKQLIKDNPLRYESYELLADLYERTGNLDASMAICQQMTLLDPSQPGNSVRIAALQMKQKKFDAAIRTLNEARIKFPTEAQVTYSLGLALSEAKRYQESLAIFEQARQEAQNGQTQMLDGQFYFAYGAAAEQAGLVDEAAELLKKSIELDPDNCAEACNYLGYMWVDRGQKLEEGARWIRKALAMEPDKAAYMDSLGWYFYKKGDYKQAVENLKRAATLIQPEDPIVDEHLGDAYAGLNDTTKALNYWQRAAALDKENKEITAKIGSAKEKLAHQTASVP